MLEPSQLHVFAVRPNPPHRTAPHRDWVLFVQSMVDAGVSLTVIECAQGDEDHHHSLDFVRHIPVRAKARVWNEENLLNIGVHRTPEARYIAWIDAGVSFRRPDWPIATLLALRHHDIVQPWSDAYALGPNDEPVAHHRSFCRQYFHRQPMAVAPNPDGPGDDAANIYPHPGYAWAMTRQAFDGVGGLFELGGMGAGGDHMAWSLIGEADTSIQAGMSDSYRREVKRWERRALRHIDRNIGYVPGTIEHRAPGRTSDRGTQPRRDMFAAPAFDPLEDLKRNSHGVLELASDRPHLRHDFDLYLHGRNEGLNAI